MFVYELSGCGFKSRYCYPSASVFILIQEPLDFKIYLIQIWTILWSVMGLQLSKLFLVFQHFKDERSCFSSSSTLNKYLSYFASLFISGVNSTLKQYFAFTFVFDSTKKILPAFDVATETIICLKRASGLQNNLSSSISSFPIFFGT